MAMPHMPGPAPGNRVSPWDTKPSGFVQGPQCSKHMIDQDRPQSGGYSSVRAATGATVVCALIARGMVGAGSGVVARAVSAAQLPDTRDTTSGLSLLSRLVIWTMRVQLPLRMASEIREKLVPAAGSA